MYSRRVSSIGFVWANGNASANSGRKKARGGVAPSRFCIRPRKSSGPPGGLCVQATLGAVKSPYCKKYDDLCPCKRLLLATESTEEHGKKTRQKLVADRAGHPQTKLKELFSSFRPLPVLLFSLFFPWLSVDSVAKISP